MTYHFITEPALEGGTWETELWEWEKDNMLSSVHMFMPFEMCICCICGCWVAQLYLTLCDPHGLQPAKFLCPLNFPGKNIGAGCHFLLQGIFPTRIEPMCPASAGGFFTAELSGKPRIYCVNYLIKKDELNNFVGQTLHVLACLIIV